MPTRDETWLRLVDVPQALAQRAYREAAVVVVEVVDPLLAANSGRYRIAADGVRRVRRPRRSQWGYPTSRRPISAEPPGEHWLFAGRVDEHRPGAVAAADALFATDGLRCSGTFF
ncbi:sterol carrier protein domain-containing protein [Nocardia abscessus]|uniref:sterol carrier protein domain-containing protein n=1 Tax=Nocardia abscessus TaxID=120957 RepID=UPI002455355B|nr:sterol carrier protein domain-containing protein [Nocardia abscessus]